MANQPEIIQYDAGVRQLESTDPVDGGVGAVSNAPLLNLANRTAYLKQHVDNIESGATIPPTLAPINSPGLTGTPTAPTAPLGDNSQKLANTAFVQATVNGVLSKSVAGGVNVTLTAIEAGNGILVFTGALTASIAVIVPATSKSWIISNQTSGAFLLTVKTAAGTGIAVAQGKNQELYCDGTNVLQSSNDFTSVALAGTPTTPTPTSGDNSTTVANTGFVFNATDGLQTVNVAGSADVTLTQAQYGAAILNLTGALTGNINLKFPQQTGQWVVANSSTGAFAITAKTTAGGTPATVTLPQGSAVLVYSDGTNMALASSVGNQASFTSTPFAPAAGTTVLTVPTGYTVANIFVERNGALLEPPDFTATNGSTITLTNATIAGDKINVYAFKTFTVANAVQKTGDTMSGPLSLPSATDATHAMPLGQANQIYGGSVTPVTAGTTTVTSANAGMVLIDATAGNVIINLPVTSAQIGLPFEFVRIDSTPANSVTINRASTDTIDGVLTSFQLVGQFARRKIRSNGVGTWYTVSVNFASNCSVYQSTAQTGIVAATFTKVSLQTKTTDNGAEFDATTNYRFTAKQAGLYQINGSINVSSPSSTNGYFAAIYQNGTMIARGTQVTGYGSPVQACSEAATAIQLAAGDYIELYCYGDAGFNLVNGPSATRLSIARIQ